MKIEIIDYHQKNIPDQVIHLVMRHMENKTKEDIMKILDLASKSSNVLLLVLWKDHEAIAFSFGNMSVGLESEGFYFWLNEFYVLESYQHQGYGHMLFLDLKQKLKNKGVNYMALVTGHMNNHAKQFYEKEGLKKKDYLWHDLSLD